jgi:hypothetical protein
MSISSRVTEILEKAFNSITGKIKVECELNVADVQIGAVEIKDGATDQRAVVDSTGKLAVLAEPTLNAVPSIYNVTMTTADTEYSQVLPANCKGFTMSIIDPVGTANFRVAFVTGKVATPTVPYLKFDDCTGYFEDTIKLATSTLYFACSGAGKVMQIVALA